MHQVSVNRLVTEGSSVLYLNYVKLSMHVMYVQPGCVCHMGQRICRDTSLDVYVIEKDHFQKRCDGLLNRGSSLYYARFFNSENYRI